MTEPLNVAVNAAWGGQPPPPVRKAQDTAALFARALGEPLYQRIELIARAPNDQLRDLRMHEQRFDGYCPLCKKETTFMIKPSADAVQLQRTERVAAAAVISPGNNRGNSKAIHYWTNPFSLETTCARAGHRSTFHFIVEGPPFFQENTLGPTYLIKTGQYPSLTDFQMGDIDEFGSVMTESQRSEFVRAINCGAHGFNVAACVYFRRVFETELAYAKAAHLATNGAGSLPDWDAAGTSERMKMVADELPKFMRDHPQMYKLLSLGLHELSEEECGEQLPVLRQAIELMMRDKLRIKRDAKQREDTSKLISMFASEQRKKE